MEPWQRFGRQRLAQSRWNCEPAAIAAVDRQAFEAAWQRQAQMEQVIVAQIAPEAIPAALLEGLATSLGAWLDEGGFTPAERAAIVVHHARLESARPRGRIPPRCRPGICGIRRSLCARNSA